MTLVRKGLRINARKVDSHIGCAFKQFAKWLRQRYEFPVRVPVYLSNKDKIIDRDGEPCFSLFFAPFENITEPYIRIATGDYPDMVEECGKGNATFELLYSLALGVVKYQKWLDDNAGLDSYEAEADATELMYAYIDEVRNTESIAD